MNYERIRISKETVEVCLKVQGRRRIERLKNNHGNPKYGLPIIRLNLIAYQ
jgi:hypothetical protein